MACRVAWREMPTLNILQYAKSSFFNRDDVFCYFENSAVYTLYLQG